MKQPRRSQCRCLGGKGIRNASSESNKCNGIDSVFEIDEAAKVAGNISNDSSAGTDEYERNDESNIAIGHSCGWDESKDKFPWQSKEVHDVVAAGRHLLLALFALLTLLLIVILSLNGEGISKLVQPGAGSHHHRVVRLLHHLVHGALELLDPDHDSAVVSVAWATQKGNLLLLGEVLGVLGVEDGVVNALSFYALCDLPWLSNVDIHDQVFLVAFRIGDLQTDSLRCLLVVEDELALL